MFIAYFWHCAFRNAKTHHDIDELDALLDGLVDQHEINTLEAF